MGPIEEGIYRFRVGAFDCLAVSDGTHPYEHPLSLLLVNATEAERERVAQQDGIPEDVWDGPYTCLLVDTGAHRVLIDTGGGKLAPTTGKLVGNLKAAGVSPGEVDTVVITHGHGDHFGGTLDDAGGPAFPNARYVISKAEWDFWASEPALAELPLPDALKAAFRQMARDQLEPIRDQFSLVASDAEIVPGVRLLPAPGHTPGQVAVLVSSGEDKLLYLSDALILTASVEHPEWYAAVDLDPEQTVATRRQLLDRAATENLLVMALHFPFPGLGRVVESARPGQREWESLT